MDLDKLETFSVDLIRKASKQHEYVVSYSGGKDSQVLLHLFRLAKVPHTIVYRNTTIDPPGTLSFVKSQGAEVLQPKYTFFELMRKKGIPSFARRFCCDYLKEPYITQYLALGIRQCESKKRAKIYDAPEFCRLYTKKKSTCQLLPILYWDDDAVSQYIVGNSIKCHPLYYDDNGRFCVNRRLGCMGCPLPYNRSIDDFIRYPKLVRQWTRNVAIFRDTHQHRNECRLFANEYEQFAGHLFFHSYTKFYETTYGLFPIDWHKELEKRFNVQL